MPLPKLLGTEMNIANALGGGQEDLQPVAVDLPSSAAATRGGDVQEKPLKRLKPKPTRRTHTGQGHARRTSRPHIPRRR